MPNEIKDIQPSKLLVPYTTCRYLIVIGDLERGEYRFQQSGNLLATVWMDKKLVYIMSTNTSPDETTTCNRRQKDGSRITVSANVHLQYMNGVDRADQYRGYYKYKLKSKKFYM